MSRFFFLKKFFFFLAIICLLSGGFATPVLAYDSTGNSDVNYYGDVFVPALEAQDMNLESFVDETFKALIFGVPQYTVTQWYEKFFKFPLSSVFNCFGETDMGACVSEIPVIGNLLSLQSQNPTTQKRGLFASFQKPFPSSPVSTQTYLSWLKNRLDPVPPAQAANEGGFGFNTLNTVIDKWTVVRNFSYGLIATALVIVGLMIMFKIKISPQAVVTIQASIPKLIITLLLITFSYAIVGLLIDFCWVITLLFANFFSVPDNVLDIIKADNVLFWFANIHTGGRLMLAIVVIFVNFSGSLLLASTVASPIVGLVLLILFVILGITIFRILFMLISSYAYIVLYTVISPLWIFLNIFPNSKSASSWFKAILSRIAVFPIVTTLLVISWSFMPSLMEYVGELSRISSLLHINDTNLPLMGNISNVVASCLVGLTLVFITPKISLILQKLLQTMEFGGESAIGEAYKPISPYVQQGAGYGIERIGEKIQSTRFGTNTLLGRIVGTGTEIAGKMIGGKRMEQIGELSKVEHHR